MENLIVNIERNRFEYIVDGYIAFIDYKFANDIYTLTHTEVPPELGGKGIGRQLVELVFEYIDSKKFKLIPICPFVTTYLKRNPEWKSLLAKGYIVK